MKIVLALASLAVLGACSNAPQSAPADWGYRPGQHAPSVISEFEFEQLTAQVTDFKAQRATLSNIVRASSDSSVRAQHLRSIDDLNGRIQMLEYRLRAAGRPTPG